MTDEVKAAAEAAPPKETAPPSVEDRLAKLEKRGSKIWELVHTLAGHTLPKDE